jgi:hypothetical protein
VFVLLEDDGGPDVVVADPAACAGVNGMRDTLDRAQRAIELAREALDRIAAA